MAITLKYATKAQLLTSFFEMLSKSDGYERCRLSAKMDGWIKEGFVVDKDIESAGKVADVKSELEANAMKLQAVESVKADTSVITASSVGGNP